MSEGLDISALPVLLPAGHFFLLDLFHSLCAALPVWNPMAVVPPTFWALERNPGLTLTASVAFMGPHSGTLLLHVCPQHLSLTKEEDSITPFYLSPSGL